MLQVLKSLGENPNIASRGPTPRRQTRLTRSTAGSQVKRVTLAQLAPYLAKFQLKPKPEVLHRKMSDLTHTPIYILAVAQRPGKHEAIDFVTLHTATLAVFFPAIIA